MKINKCPKCNKTQASGKFCLDCGTKLNEVVNTVVQFRPIGTSRTAEQVKRDVRNWLGRLGVPQSDIQISCNAVDSQAEIQYTLNKIMYTFTSFLQKNVTHNLAAIEQFLHYRVLGIERGIETVEKAFAGYEALPDYTNKDNFDPYVALGFKERVDLETARAKFKQLVKRFHPDVNKSKEAASQFINLKKAIDMIEKGAV